jgi:hypothetical protein
MTNQETTSNVSNPKIFALIIGVAASSFSIVITLALLTPVTAFFNPATEVIVGICIGTAIAVFCTGYVYGLLRHCQRARENLEAIVASISAIAPPVTVDLEDVEPSQFEDGFIRIKGTPKTVRVTDGVTVEHVQALASASLPAVSQRALDKAGVITRDPSVEVNAGVFIKWLGRNGFVTAIGNSRYAFTPLGEKLLKSVGGTRGSHPPTTTTE